MAKLSAEEKLGAVQRYLTGKENARTVAKDLGVSHHYLLTWVKQYKLVQRHWKKIMTRSSLN